MLSLCWTFDDPDNSEANDDIDDDQPDTRYLTETDESSTEGEEQEYEADSEEHHPGRADGQGQEYEADRREHHVVGTAEEPNEADQQQGAY